MTERNSEIMAGEPGFEPGPTESESGDNLTKSTPVRHNSAPVHGDTNQCVSTEVSNFGAVLCSAADINMDQAGEDELRRVSVPDVIRRIRAKQEAKPKHTPIPGPTP